MVLDRLKNIKLLLLDVDGVLTDGGIFYNDNGTETKVFDVKDGLGIKLLMEAGNIPLIPSVSISPFLKAINNDS